MHDAFIPLVVSAGVFLAVLLWRVRPVALWRTRHESHREARREAQSRIEAAKTDAERAEALCDAAEVAARRVRGQGSATALYLRAMRADPTSVHIVERAAAGLIRRPFALEGLLWRRLALVRWSDSREATLAALNALRALYEGRLRSSVRARALENARETLAQAEAPQRQE